LQLYVSKLPAPGKKHKKIFKVTPQRQKKRTRPRTWQQELGNIFLTSQFGHSVSVVPWQWSVTFGRDF
jgi:hypothetical protein